MRKARRYDFTVPYARYKVQHHQNEITFLFSDSWCSLNGVHTAHRKVGAANFTSAMPMW